MVGKYGMRTRIGRKLNKYEKDARISTKDWNMKRGRAVMSLRKWNA
jgi:hypothetical protein